MHVCAPIPGDQRLALMIHGITVFEGGTAHLPVLHGASTTHSAPETIEMDVPKGLRVIPPLRWSFENDYGSYESLATNAPPFEVRVSALRLKLCG